jgi:hypothetical protein
VHEQARIHGEQAFQHANQVFNAALAGLQAIDWEGLHQQTQAHGEEVGRHAGAHVQRVFEEAVTGFRAVDWEGVHHGAMQGGEEAGKQALEHVKVAYGGAVDGLQEVKWEELPDHAKKWVQEHPGTTAIITLSLIVACCPQMVTRSVLWTMGFSSRSPIAGTWKPRVSNQEKTC